jgi:uncharacterized protein (DUF433 family)
LRHCIIARVLLGRSTHCRTAATILPEEWLDDSGEEHAMSIEVVYPHIATGGGPARLSRLPRIRVAQIVMDYLAHGWSAEEMCRQHPSLTPGEVHSAMAFYFDHQAEVDAEIRAESEQNRLDRPPVGTSPFAAKLCGKGSAK